MREVHNEHARPRGEQLSKRIQVRLETIISAESPGNDPASDPTRDRDKGMVGRIDGNYFIARLSALIPRFETPVFVRDCRF